MASCSEVSEEGEREETRESVSFQTLPRSPNGQRSRQSSSAGWKEELLERRYKRARDVETKLRKRKRAAGGEKMKFEVLDKVSWKCHDIAPLRVQEYSRAIRIALSMLDGLEKSADFE